MRDGHHGSLQMAVPPRCLAAGVPARVIRENVDWR